MSEKSLLVCLAVRLHTAAPAPGLGAGDPHFCTEVALPRLLTLFERAEAETTWFVSAPVLDAHPGAARAVIGAGHELAVHGIAPGEPGTGDPHSALIDAATTLRALTGAPPRGHCATTFQGDTAARLVESGFHYDHSLCRDDVWPGVLTLPGDRGVLVQMPASAALRDTAGAAPESDWHDAISWIHREQDRAVVSLVLHPGISGQPQRLLRLERFLDALSEHAGVRFCTLSRAAGEVVDAPPGAGGH